MRHAAAEVGAEEAGVELDGRLVVAQRLSRLLLRQGQVAEELVEAALAREGANGLAGEAARLGEVLLLRGLQRPVVEVVGRLCRPQRGEACGVALGAELAAGREFRRRPPVLLHALLRRRVGREQPVEPAAAAPSLLLGDAHELLLQRDGRPGVVAGPAHVAGAVEVAFQLGFAPVARVDQAGPDVGPGDDQVAEPGVDVAHRHADAGGQHTHLQQGAALLRLGAVAGRSVHDLVTEHGSQLRLALQPGQQAAVDGDLAAGQRPGVRRGIVQHRELVGEVAVRGRRQPLADLVDVGRDLRQGDEVAAFALSRRRVLLPSDLQLLALGHQLQLLLARDRVGAAGGQRQRGGEHE